MAKAGDHKSLGGELRVVYSVHLHSDEAEPDHWDYTIPQRVCWAFGVLLHQDLDQVGSEIWDVKAALYKAREHCYSDLRCRLFWHCF